MTTTPKEPELGLLRTEQVDSKFQMLDVMTVSELLQAMNESDTEVPKAVSLVLPKIEKAIDSVVDRMLQGGRLIYMGAGTSGRISSHHPRVQIFSVRVSVTRREASVHQPGCARLISTAASAASPSSANRPKQVAPLPDIRESRHPF